MRPGDLSLERAVELLSCMAHPVRLAVLARLASSGPASVGTLVEALGVEQSAMSHHLRLMREARLVVGDRDGRRVLYRLHDGHVGTIVQDVLAHAAERDGGVDE
jgi:DNA-binding transcriptional ArsR family regulator